MTLSEFLIYGLATWRVSHLLVWERGPFDVFVRIRELAGIRHDEEKKPLVFPETFWGELLSCVWCSSVWVGTFWAAMILIFPAYALKVALLFALSAAAILVDNWLEPTL